MFIYFWEQVWSNENSVNNFETDEISRRFWDAWHLDNRGTGYPRGFMEEGIDYYNY